MMITSLRNTTLSYRPQFVHVTMNDQRAVIVGLSGCSSSGKTTLARLLRDIFPNTFVLHEDDFYRPEEESASHPIHPIPSS